MARDQEAEVAKLLEPGQLKRFRQIAVQQRGPLAFLDPDVAADLGLTPEQKKRVREILDEAGSGGPKLNVVIEGLRIGPPSGDGPRFGPPGGGPRGRPPEWPGENWRRAREKILEHLTPEQRQKWGELTGEPFKGEIHFHGPARRMRP
jgi:hypothetical protein